MVLPVVRRRWVTAAMMAESGYEGDMDSLDTKPGFFDAQGYLGGAREAITAAGGTATEL